MHRLIFIIGLYLLFVNKFSLASDISYQELWEKIKEYYTPVVESYLIFTKIHNYKDMIFYLGDPTSMRDYRHRCSFDNSWKKWKIKPFEFEYITICPANLEEVTEEFDGILTPVYTINLYLKKIPDEFTDKSIDYFPGKAELTNVVYNNNFYGSCPSCNLAIENDESTRSKTYKYFELWFINNKLENIRIKDLKSWSILLGNERKKELRDSIKTFKTDSIETFKNDSVKTLKDSIETFKNDSIKLAQDIETFKKDSIESFKNDSIKTIRDSIETFKNDSIKTDSIETKAWKQKYGLEAWEVASGGWNSVTAWDRDSIKTIQDSISTCLKSDRDINKCLRSNLKTQSYLSNHYNEIMQFINSKSAH